MALLVSSEALIGRDEPLRTLARMLDDALAGRPAVALVSGEAGVGKTRVAGELETRARARGFYVLHGESVEFGGEDFAYGPVVAALRGLPQGWTAEALGDLPPEAHADLAALLPRAAPAPGERRPPSRAGPGRLCELLLGLLERFAAEEAPLLLVLEDMHWADRSSRDLIAFLARNLGGAPIACVATYRTDELAGSHPLRRLAAELGRRRGVVRVELEPLGRDDVARQLEDIAGGAVPASLADELHARAGGNPFFVEELFASRREDGAALPEQIAETALLRAEQLGAPAQRLLVVVAAAGGRIGHVTLGRLVEDPGPALRAALDAQVLVREADDRGVAFRHGLMGEAVYARLLPGERTELHREIAATLAGEPGAPAAQLAEQCQRAGEYADALTASVSAGREAMRVYAYAEADAHLGRALALWDDVEPATRSRVAKVELLALTAQAARHAGDDRRAVALCREALALIDHDADPMRAAGLYERLGEYHYWDDAASLECYERALALLPAHPGPERARLMAAQGHALMGLRRWLEARERCEAALAVGDPDAEPGARITLGLVLGFLGEPNEGETQLRRALDLAGALGAGEEIARAHIHLAELLRLRGQRAEALAVAVAGEDAAARFGMRGSFGHFMYVNAAEDLLRLGHWDEAERRLAEAERRDLGRTAATMCHTLAGELCALRGEAPAAREHLRHADELAAAGLPGEFLAPIRGAWAALALTEGDPQAARDHAAAALELTRDALYTPPLLSLAVRAEADLYERARAGRSEHDDRRAGALLAELDALLEAEGWAPPDALAHRALALAEASRARGGHAVADWPAAVDAFERLGQPHPVAYARLRQAEAALLAANDRATAGRLLVQAWATAVALRAAPLRDEIEALARRARLELAAEAAPAAPAPEAGPLGLTARETEVLRLLADGLTNREIAGRLFISQKTVAAHVAHIFEKLDVHTRVEAAARAQRLGVLDTSH